MNKKLLGNRCRIGARVRVCVCSAVVGPISSLFSRDPTEHQHISNADRWLLKLYANMSRRIKIIDKMMLGVDGKMTKIYRVQDS